MSRQACYVNKFYKTLLLIKIFYEHVTNLWWFYKVVSPLSISLVLFRIKVAENIVDTDKMTSETRQRNSILSSHKRSKVVWTCVLYK